MRCSTLLAFLVLLGAPTLGAAKPECVLIQQTTAYLPDGKQDNVDILIRHGLIKYVGPNSGLADRSGSGWCAGGITYVSGQGKTVTAGLVEPYAQLGLMEVSLEAFTVDSHAVPQPKTKRPQVHASFRAVDAYNPRSTLIPITRMEGVLSAVSVPEGGLVQGQSIWVDLAGGSQRQAVRNERLAVHATLMGSERPRTQLYSRLRQLLDETRAWMKGKVNPKPAFATPELRAMVPVLRKEIPLVVRADRASDMEALLRIQKEASISLVIVGGAEAWLLAEELAKSRVPVVINPLVAGPHTFDGIRGRSDNAALLHKAGVLVMMSTFWSHNARTLRQVAGNAVREGMPHGAAVRAITETPARVFGMKKHGRIEVGFRANLVMWSGDPLELSTYATQIWINGETVPLESRQTHLRERYRDLTRDRTALPLKRRLKPTDNPE